MPYATVRPRPASADRAAASAADGRAGRWPAARQPGPAGGGRASRVPGSVAPPQFRGSGRLTTMAEGPDAGLGDARVLRAAVPTDPARRGGRGRSPGVTRGGQPVRQRRRPEARRAPDDDAIACARVSWRCVCTVCRAVVAVLLDRGAGVSGVEVVVELRAAADASATSMSRAAGVALEPLRWWPDETGVRRRCDRARRGARGGSSRWSGHDVPRGWSRGWSDHPLAPTGQHAT